MDRRQGRLIHSMVMFLLGASLVAGVMVVTDSLYYGSLKLIWQAGTPLDQPFVTSLLSLRWEGGLTWTVWNNLAYNLKVDNLALHGLHPRYTHLLVNFPLLYGPLAVMALWAFVTTMKKAREESPGYLFYVLAGIVVNAMIGLSLMPHQEARFLVPMLVPLVMVYTWDQTSSIGTLPFMLLWCAFNLVTSFIFGNLHQAGVVPTISFVQRQSMGINGCELLASGDLTCDITPVGGPITTNGFNLTTHVIFHKTYMPPRHLLSFPLAWKDGPAQVSIEDVAGDKTKLYNALKPRQGSAYRKHDKDRVQVEFAASKETPGTYERTLLICPNVTPLPDLPGQRYMLISSYSPHINFDHMGDMFALAKEYDSPINLASLNVFAIISDHDE
ncbi:Alg9-like mannosyltransferase family-domain-containing protein [Chlamydoabsidia padenii]|nr:Alg9-like mannosyltransferase family-domain-containing protein [Chlamydoabsidia padenii]